MRLLFLIILFVFLTSAAQASPGVNPDPDTVILVSDIYDLKFVDDQFAVAVTRFGVSSFYLDEQISAFRFYQEIHLELESPRLRLFGDMAVVSDGDTRLHFFSAAALPELAYLGTTDFGVFIADFVIAESNLYISTCFDGIWRYSLEDVSAPEFLDSSWIAICVTKLETSGDTLFALDEYNGLMSYDLSGDGFGVFLGYMYIPRRVYDFARRDSRFYMAYDGGCYVADFDAVPPAIVDSIIIVDPVYDLCTSDTYLIVVFSNHMQLRPLNNLSYATSLNTPNNRTHGDLLTLDNIPRFVLPEREGGATLFNLANVGRRASAFHREGPITGVFIYDDKLYTCGISMPIDVYDIIDGGVRYKFPIYEDFDTTRLMIHNGDTLFAVDAYYNTVNFFFNITDSDPHRIVLGYAFPTPAYYTNDLIYVEPTVNGQQIMLAVWDRSIDVWVISDDNGPFKAKTWYFSSDDIHAVSIKDSIVYVEGFRYPEIRAYGFSEQFDSVFYKTVGLTSHPYKTLVVGDYLYSLQWELIKVIDITDPRDPTQGLTVGLPFTVYDACTYGRWMYCVGPEGVVVLDISSQPPVIVDQGGRGGISLAVGSDILAVNSGDGLYIYQIDTTDFVTWTPVDSIMPGRLSLSQNYPNPFNLGTTISYSLERKAEVDLTIYNLLGQKVATLVNTTQPAGNYSVRWNGVTSSGNVAATGVYFYRLTTGEFRETRKMLLIK